MNLSESSGGGAVIHEEPIQFINDTLKDVGEELGTFLDGVGVPLGTLIIILAIAMAVGLILAAVANFIRRVGFGIDDERDIEEELFEDDSYTSKGMYVPKLEKTDFNKFKWLIAVAIIVLIALGLSGV